MSAGPRGTALDTVRALNLMGRKEPPVAMCPVCPDEVLVFTFRWPGAEFYCLRCERTFGFLDPRPATSTDELDARVEAARLAFAELFPPALADAGEGAGGPQHETP